MEIESIIRGIELVEGTSNTKVESHFPLPIYHLEQYFKTVGHQLDFEYFNQLIKSRNISHYLDAIEIVHTHKSLFERLEAEWKEKVSYGLWNSLKTCVNNEVDNYTHLFCSTRHYNNCFVNQVRESEITVVEFLSQHMNPEQDWVYFVKNPVFVMKNKEIIHSFNDDKVNIIKYLENQTGSEYISFKTTGFCDFKFDNIQKIDLKLGLSGNNPELI